MIKKYRETFVTRAEKERIVILAETNMTGCNGYEARIATEEGYKEFKKYFGDCKFCCQSLERHCEEYKYVDSTRFIEYDRRTRTFAIGCYVIPYCPFCGTRFLKELGREWMNLVDEQFGEEYFMAPKMYELPEEFLTDEWWKKRGL